MIAVRGADTHRNWRSAPPTAIIRGRRAPGGADRRRGCDRRWTRLAIVA